MSDVTRRGSYNAAQHLARSTKANGVSTRDAMAPVSSRVQHRDFRTLTHEEMDVLQLRVTVHLREGNFEAAIAAIQDAGQRETDAILSPEDTVLSHVLPTRVANMLEKEFGAITAGDLLRVSTTRLMAVKGIGWTVVNDIDAAMRKLGLVRRVA